VTGPATREPRAAAGAEEVRLLFYRSGGERFALDVAFVREILPAHEVTPVPFVPESVAGIINHRGMIYTLVRFCALAGLGRGDGERQVVLLRIPEMAVGLAVEGIEGIEVVPARFLGFGPGEETVGAAAFLRRAADPRGRLVHAVDAERLIDTIYQLPDLQRAGEG
jgi:purine-binding chemotaxis protein CheW